jgi:hypothetical protein
MINNLFQLHRKKRNLELYQNNINIDLLFSIRSFQVHIFNNLHIYQVLEKVGSHIQFLQKVNFLVNLFIGNLNIQASKFHIFDINDPI